MTTRGPQSLAIATVLLWSIGHTLGRIVSHGSSYAEFVLCFAFALTTYAVYAKCTGRDLIGGLKRVLKRPACLPFLVLGYFVYWFAVTHCNRSFDRAAEPIILNYTFPLFTVLFTELFFGRRKAPLKQRASEGAGLALGFVSMIVLVTRGDITSLDVSDLHGLGWGMLAGASYGLFSAFSSTVERRDQIAFLFATCSVGLIGMAGATVITGIESVHVSVTDLLVVLALGTLVEGLGYIAWTGANRAAREQNVGIAAATALIYFLPVLSVLVASIAFGENDIFHPYVATTILMLVAGSFISQYSMKQSSEEPRLQPAESTN